MERDGIQVFERDAARCDAWFDSQRGFPPFASEVQCLERLAAGVPHLWLDVGSGPGRFAEALGVEVGLDPARPALRYARRRGIQVVAAEGQALPFRDGEFGAVFAVATLCFADDVPGVLLSPPDPEARIRGEIAPCAVGVGFVLRSRSPSTCGRESPRGGVREGRLCGDAVPAAACACLRSGTVKAGENLRRHGPRNKAGRRGVPEPENEEGGNLSARL